MIPERLAFWFKVYAVATILFIPVILLIGAADPAFAQSFGVGALMGLIIWPFIMWGLERAGKE